MKISEVEKLKVALIEDFSSVDGGAQNVMRVFMEIFPNAPLYTVTYFPENFRKPYKDTEVHQSFISKLPFKKRLEHQYKLFYQLAVEQFDLRDYDLVISSSWAGYAKGVIVPSYVKHLSYIYTVPRFLWGLPTAKHSTLGPIYKNIIMPPLHHFWRIWDRQTAQRPDGLITISEVVRERVNKFWRRDSDVIYPPVDVEEILGVEPQVGDYFVNFGRLEKYKNVDMAIKACINSKQQLKIIGTGAFEKQLKDLVKDLKGEEYIEFLGYVNDAERNNIVAGAKAFVFPCPSEDFGIVPVEAMAAGTPVIAFDSGGVTETVVDSETGVLVKEFSQESLNRSVSEFNPDDFSAQICRKHAKKFSKESFKNKFVEYIAEFYDE